MKRNFTDSLTRTTAGYLPVPIFNQKKRSRQPLTSNPQKNDPSSGLMETSLDPFDFFPLSGDIAWENRIPDVTHQKKALNLGSEGNRQTNCKEGWNQYNFTPLNRRSDFISDSELLHGDISTFGMTSQTRVPEHCKKSSRTRIVSEQKYSSTSWSNTSSTTTSRPQNQKPYAFRHNSQQTTVKEKKCVILEVGTLQKQSALQLKLNEKVNSLRIISAVIESMKLWSQYTDRAALLFEVLATLDSAVISGTHGAKTFILRDGKDTIPCIFYETDRDLPRLIRGRVHRCMGNYDKKKNLFKCVSVRPASLAEQRTFPEFIKTSDAEIKQYVKSLNED